MLAFADCSRLVRCQRAGVARALAAGRGKAQGCGGLNALRMSHQSQHRQQQACSAAERDQPPLRRVLSIQSHVVHGYVGGKAAVFPLQLLGFDVDPIHSVQFSNHTGYPNIKGHVFDGQHLAQLLEGLQANNLLGGTPPAAVPTAAATATAHAAQPPSAADALEGAGAGGGSAQGRSDGCPSGTRAGMCHVGYSHLLTGYIGSLSLLQGVAAVAQALRRANPHLTYVCDPVLGDEGQLYVRPELVDAYRTTLLPLATVLTPNQFEAQLLTGARIGSEADAVAACRALHNLGPRTVVMTSVDGAGGSGSSSSGDDDANEMGQQLGGAAAGSTSSPHQQQQQQQPNHQQYITLVASTTVPQREGRPGVFRLHIPKLPAYFTGTGDLLSALLLARLHEHPDDAASAVELAVAGLQGVLHATAAACDPHLLASRARSAQVFAARELRLVQNQHLLTSPAVELHIEAL